MQFRGAQVSSRQQRVWIALGLVFLFALQRWHQGSMTFDGWLVRNLQPDSSVDDHVCHWYTSKSLYGKEYQLCLRDSRDHISNFVRMAGQSVHVHVKNG